MRDRASDRPIILQASELEKRWNVGGEKEEGNASSKRDALPRIIDGKDSVTFRARARNSQRRPLMAFRIHLPIYRVLHSPASLFQTEERSHLATRLPWVWTKSFRDFLFPLFSDFSKPCNTLLKTLSLIIVFLSFSSKQIAYKS